MNQYYFIWSTAHAGWIGKSNAYTTDLTQAKTFEEAKAKTILARHNTDSAGTPKAIATPTSFYE